jgi:transposase
MIRVYTYGAFTPLENVERIEDQLRRAGRYYNELVALVRVREDGLTDENRKQRFAAYKAAVRAARSQSGLYWGTYLTVEARIDAAQKATAKENWKEQMRAERRGREPRIKQVRFRRYDGSGTLTVQIQHNARSRAKATRLDLATDTRVQLRPWPALVPVRPGQDPTRGPSLVNQSGPLMELRLRVGSEEPKRTPIWTRLAVRQHRPLPRDGRILWVHARRERHGTRLDWTVAFVMEVPDVPLRTGERTVGIDVGWRRMPDGTLRVAYCADDQERAWDLRLPERDVDALEWVERFLAGRQNNLNAHRAELVEYLKAEMATPSQPIGGSDRPVSRPPSSPALWKSAERFARAVARAWRRGPVPEAIANWYRQDRHLCDAIAGARDNVYARRNQLFATWAKELASVYNVIKVEKLDHRPFARKGGVYSKKKNGRAVPVDRRLAGADLEGEDGYAELERSATGEKEKEDDAATPTRRLRSLAAPAMFVNRLRNTAAREGAAVVGVRCAETTQLCHLCGAVNKWADSQAIVLPCLACGAEWDQDLNAAKNILASSDVATSSANGQPRGMSKRQTRLRQGARARARGATA